jgi:ribosomal protein L12E/L44/L45/RPP1/RPP2
LCPQVKAYLADPSAFASSAPEAGAGGDSAPAEEKKEEAKAEEEEESDEDMGFSLFD